LSDLERRLAAVRPSADGLDADAMLFAAGRASARPGVGRFAWPALAGCLALTVAGLAGSLTVERSERLALAQKVRTLTPSPPPMPLPAAAEEPVADPDPSSYFASHRALEQGLDAWPVRPLTQAEPPHESPRPPTLVPRAWQRDAGLEP
jgi:hypothetical protein